jgi:hypothetical protein
VYSRAAAPGFPTCNVAEEVERMAKILLVEDNEMNRDMLARRLNKRG